MTHPDTLTTPRAVVEQAIDALDLSYALLESAKSYHYPKVLDAYKTLRAALQLQAADDKIKALAAKAPKDVRIHPGGGEVIPQAASDCRTCQHLSEAWGVCEARPKCVGGEQYVYFPEKQLWDKTPRNDGQAAQAAAEPVIPAGFALVPIRATAAMEEVFSEEGWEWANVLAAAEAVTEGEYEAALEGTPPATQAVLTAALAALKAMQSYAAAERKGLKICDDAITQIKALKGPTP